MHFFQSFSDREKTLDIPSNSSPNNLSMSLELFPPDGGPKKSPMQSARSNGPCLVCMADILANSGAIDPVAEPVTNLGFINDSKCTYIEFLHFEGWGRGSHDCEGRVVLLLAWSRRELLI